MPSSHEISKRDAGMERDARLLLTITTSTTSTITITSTTINNAIVVSVSLLCTGGPNLIPACG